MGGQGDMKSLSAKQRDLMRKLLRSLPELKKEKTLY